MRRDNLIFISEDSVSDVLEQKLPLELMPAISISMIQDNYKAQQGMIPPVRIGEFTSYILQQKSYFVPRISYGNGDIKISGAGVFSGKTNDFVGWLGDYDILALRLVKGDGANLIIEADYQDELFIFEMDDFQSSINYQYKSGKDHFTIQLESEGFFAENHIDGIDLSNDEWNDELERQVENEIRDTSMKIIEKMQQSFYTDIFDLSDVIKRNNYRRWKEVKDRWDGKDGYFPKAEIVVDAKVRIRHFMTKEQLK